MLNNKKDFSPYFSCKVSQRNKAHADRAVVMIKREHNKSEK